MEAEQIKQRVFLYARKSTDVEDKQVLSIDAQLTELRAYAKNENLDIVDELIEKQSAKVPGRPVFGELIKRIEQGEANSILAWHPDRLARNSIDGGQIIYLLDCNNLTSLKFPTFWFENTSQGKFMLSIAFGQSKYYVDSLSENTKRGLRQKVRRGEYPSHAPLGYINDLRSKSIFVDKRNSVIVREAFELYKRGDQRLEDIANFLFNKNIKTRKNGKPLKKDRISFILSNPFYYGHFRYNGEMYEGRHTPIIPKKLFDEVQAVLAERSRPRKDRHNNPKPYCGLLSCATCSMAITAETQKGHVYYRCTRKSKTIDCAEPYIREEELDKQITELLKTVSLKPSRAKELRIMLDKDEQDSTKANQAFVETTEDKIHKLQIKLQILLDSYLDQDIDRQTYLDKKAELMSRKKSLEEQIQGLKQAQASWLEPMRNWINEAESICSLVEANDLILKKVKAHEIFDSNLHLSNRRVRLFKAVGGQLPLKKPWAAVAYLNENSERKEKSLFMAEHHGLEPCIGGGRK